ncbi:MAG: fumarylacetoacetate hydrolase family protein [Rikenellaceae bacterium]
MKIICMARNYDEHITELQDGAKRPTVPTFFLKPDTALLRNNDPFYCPDFSEQIDYECELVIKINRVVKDLDIKFAHRCYSEVGLGIDFTARDVQRQAIAEGLPWELCKGFDHSAAISPTFIPLEELGGDIQNLNFNLELNDQVRQSGFTGDMIFAVDEIISYISKFITLKIGDLIFTGTPVGVGAVKGGDKLRATLEGRELLNFEIR